MDREKDIELLAEANEGLKKTDIKGKGYVEVNERIKAFRLIYPRGQIITEIVSHEADTVIMKCSVYDDNGKLLSTGHAREKQSSSFINKTSYIENCETSCIGRAIGCVGIGLDRSLASYEEVANAVLQQEDNEAKQPEETISTTDFSLLKTMFTQDEIKAMLDELGIAKASQMPKSYFESKVKGEGVQIF